jgi:hypothetical protein
MKPKHQGGYSPIHTEFCERTLVTLLRGLGPWKTSIYLIGGLVPRYLFARNVDEGNVAHIGTTDVDIVLNLEVMADIEAYNRLEENLKKMGFERGRNDEGREQNHRWLRKVENGVTVVIDLLCEGSEGGKPFPLPKTAGRLSALKIPGVHLVFDDYIEVPIRAELLEEGGITIETVRIAGLSSFLILKAIAFDDRNEEKDSYDIVYTLTRFEGGPGAAARTFSKKMGGAPDEDKKLFERAINILKNRFVDEKGIAGYRKDGPTSYARFLSDPGNPEQDTRNKRDASAIIKIFLENL